MTMAYYSTTQYSAALTKSVQLEKDGDYLSKVGKHELAIRKYQQSLDIRTKLFGSSHLIVKTFKHTKVDNDNISPSGPSSIVTKSSPGFYSLLEAMKYEKDGDRLVKIGRSDKALLPYRRANDIEKRILGKDHPRTQYLQNKITKMQVFEAARVAKLSLSYRAQ